MTDITDRVRAIVARELGVHLDDVTAEARLDQDLKADHIDVVGLIVTLENEINLAVDDEQMEQLYEGTVGDLLAFCTPPLAPAEAA